MAKRATERLVKNRISEFREAAGLTRRALGALLATSPEQIARHEAGHQISPGMALAIARVLEQPLNALFPDIGEQIPKTQRDWQCLHFDLEAPLPTWHLNIELRGADEALLYLVDSADCARLDGVLDGHCAYHFIAFESCGRSIYVNTRAIQWISVIEDGVVLKSGVRHTIGALEPHFASLQIFFVNRPEPLTVACLEMEDVDLGGAFITLDGVCDVKDQFLSLRDDEGDLVYVRVEEIALVEVPTPELLEEMKQLGGDFWHGE